ncbi:uncharacterized protein [Heptranchias perlo]|uniref:uncharacterized protein isoform X2 n=1 Tax=Heptranchias perlo TaxID=212740 RepID=UPI00355A2547
MQLVLSGQDPTAGIHLEKPGQNLPAVQEPLSLRDPVPHRPADPGLFRLQIDDQNASDKMRSSSAGSSNKQAMDEDYQDSGYDRGHLYPFGLNGKESATATCTLTNAVPEEHGANVNWYQEVESVAQKLAQICHKSGRSMYLVTGAANPTKTKLNNRVSVPGLVWTALCCTYPRDQNNDPCLTDNVRSEGQDVLTYNKDFSFAFTKQMKPELDTKHATVRQLQEKLRVGKLFDRCRGTSIDDEAQTFKEVEGLIKNKIIDPVNNRGSSPLRPIGYEAAMGIFQFIYYKLLVPGGAMVQAVSSGTVEVAKVVAPIFLGVLTVVGILTLNVFSILIDNSRHLSGL